ncbi:MAG: trimethylamine methyltransferase family protein [Armatimonadetes bacterium]|nr:trimethylamine methyltransferase family protein [Armatimonadota bacterium]
MKTRSRIDVLDDAEKERIKRTMLRMLHEVGIWIECPEVVAMMARHGYRMDGHRLKPTPEETTAFLERYARHTREKSAGLREEQRPIKNFGVGVADVGILDWETGQKRRGRLDDARASALFANGLDHVTSLYVTALPADVPSDLAAIAFLVEAAKYSPKTAGFSGGQQLTVRNHQYWEAMGCLVAGGRDAYMRNPHMGLQNFDMSSPMRLTRFVTDRTRLLMRHKKLGGGATTLPLQGLTGMVTLAGCIAQALAETFGGGMFLEMVEKEMTGTAHHAFDMTPSFVPADLHYAREACAPLENTLGHIAISQMLEYLHLPDPGYNYGRGKSEAKVWDAQCGYEKMLNTVFPLLAGLCWGPVHLGELATNEYFSFEQAIIDYELVEMGNRIIEGVRVDDNALDLEAFKEGVEAGIFSGLVHTARSFRGELYLPKLASRESYAQWDKAGRKTIEERAHERVVEIFRKAEPRPKYPPDLQRELEKLLARFSEDAR